MEDSRIFEIDISNCLKLQELPYRQLLSIKALKAVHCRGCTRLTWPPGEIIGAGGEAVMKFLREGHWDVRGLVEAERFPDFDPVVLSEACVKSIDASGCEKLWKIPLDSLSQITTLTALELRGCKALK